MMRLSEVAAAVGGRLTGPDCEVTGISTDTRTLSVGDLFIALTGPNFDGHDHLSSARARGACAALVAQSQPDELPQIQVSDPRRALGELAACWRARFTLPVVALTGSNGKTTVKEMIAAILRQRGSVLATRGNLNNDIGLPLTLLSLRPDHGYAVIEMGANHPGEIAYLTSLTRPDVALITNAGPAHLEGFGDLDGVARSKGEIFDNLGPASWSIVNADDDYADYWRQRIGNRPLIDFGLDNPAKVSGRAVSTGNNRLQIAFQGRSVEVDLPLPGRHNLRNALAASAAALAAGAGLDDVAAGLATMQAVKGRLVSQPGRDGCTIIDDSYNANPASLGVALEAVAAMPGEHWLVLGDMAELGAAAADWHRHCGELARNQDFSRLYALGEHSRSAAAVFGTGGQHYPTLSALIEALTAALSEGDRPTVLIKGSRSMRMEQVVSALTGQGVLSC